MTDDRRIAEWAASLEGMEIRAFMRARRRFLKRPSPKHLRELRAAARRLRSIFDDFHDVLAARKRVALARLIEVTGQAREAANLRKTLRAAIDARERATVRPILRTLRAQERDCFTRVRKALRDLRYRT